MSQTVEYKVKIDAANSAKTLGDLENALSDLNEELKKVEPGSKAFNDLSKSAQNASKQIEGINNQIQGITAEDKIRALDGGIKILGGSVQGLVGGLGLLGIESEKLGAFEEKAASAIAFGIGLKDFSEGLGQVTESFKKSGIAAKLFGSTARTALLATGIGAIVVALGAIVAYWDEITALVSGVSTEQSDLLESQKQSVTASQAQYDAISQSENILRMQGKSEAEIRQLKMDQLKITIDTLKAQLTTQEEIKKAQVETAERNKTIAQNIIRLVTLPITAALAGIDAISKKLAQLGIIDEATNLEESFSGGIAGLIFNPEKIEKEGQAAIDETKKQLLGLENQYAGFQLQIRNERNKAADETKKKSDAEKQKEIDDEKRRQEAILGIIEDYKKKRQDLDDKTNVEKVDREEARALEELKKLGENEEAKQAIIDFYAIKRKEAQEADKLAQEELDKKTLDALFERIDKENQLEMERIAMKQYAVDSILGLVNQESAIGRAALVAKQILNAKELLITAKSALSSINISAAKAAADTSTGFAATLKAGFPQNVPLLIAYAAQAAGIISAIKSAVGGAKSAIGSAGAPVSGLSVPTVSGPSVASTPTTQTPVQQQLDVASATQTQQQPVRAYVVQGDITSGNEAASKLRQRRVVGK